MAHRGHDAGRAGTVDPPTKGEEEAPLATASQVVPEPAGWAEAVHRTQPDDVDG